MEKNVKNILDKVRALLCKTVENGASESEAEQAMIMAQKLMAKHNIEQDDIFISKNDISFDSVINSIQGHERKHWQWDLLKIIGSGYNCRVFRNEKFNYNSEKYEFVYKIYGFPEDREMVIELYKMIIPIIRNLKNKRRREYKAQCKKISKKMICESTFCKNYIEGFMYGLELRLEKAKTEIFTIAEEAMKYELMIVKKDDLLNEFIEAEVKLKNIKGSSLMELNEDAFVAGMQDGEQENMNKKLTT